MILSDVFAELVGKLAPITELRTYTYMPNPLVPPVAFPDLPDGITYDTTFRRGHDSLTVPLNVLVGKVHDKVAHERILAYVDGSGSRSFKALLDTNDTTTYTSCDSVRVASAEFAVFPVGEANFLAATFNIEITGAGS